MAGETRKDRPVRKRQRVAGDKVCQVCGDKALAHHFGALACETCKAFFRRNAPKAVETMTCEFQGNCPVDRKTRRFCPPCRLQKCFAAGMKTDLILDKDELQRRKIRLDGKRAKHSEEKTPTSSSINTKQAITSTEDLTITTSHSGNTVTLDRGVNRNCSQSVKAEMCNSTNLAVSSESMPTTFSSTDKASDSLHHSSPSRNLDRAASWMIPDEVVTLAPEIFPETMTMHSEESPSLSSLDSGSEKFEVAEELVKKHAAALTPFEHVPKDQLPSDLFMYWRLTEEERYLLARLSTAYENTVLSLLQTNPPKAYMKAEDITTEYYFEQFDTEVRNAISFAKRLEDFQSLHTEEQVALLKASTPEVLSIRSCALYVAEKDAWLTPKGYFTLEHSRILCPEHPYIKKGNEYYKIMKSIVKNDFTLYALLHCIVLFEPSDERIVNRQVVNAIHDKYVVLLRHYLQSIYSYQHCDKYFMALLEKLMIARALHKEGTHLIKKFFPNIPNQLLQEVLDLE